MADPRIKQIVIKTGKNINDKIRIPKQQNFSFKGVVKRLAKEKTVYEKEADKEKQRLEKFKGDQLKDDHDIKKQEEVINECLMMVPDTQRR